MQSFLMLFYLLDLCYAQDPEDDLGGLLGSISPELWADGKPADIAIYNDWRRLTAGMDIAGSGIVKAAYSFLTDYESKFRFVFTRTKDILPTIADDAVLNQARSFAQEMNRKHCYPDFEG